MTPLSDRQPKTAHGSLFLAILLLAAGLTGCIGTEDDGEASNPPTTEGFQLFLSSVGTADEARADLGSVRVQLSDETSTRQLTTQQTSLDLATLASQGQAILVANGASLSGTVEQTVLTFDWLSVGSQNITTARLELPVTYNVTEDTEATLTLDLDATEERGQATVSNFVVEENGQRLVEVTRSDLEGTQPDPIEPLGTPTIIATSGNNDTAPSFEINSDVNFTYELDDTNATVENVFWSFGDDQTGTGAEVTHAYRDPGFYRVRIILEGTRGQQATANTTIDAYQRIEDAGNVGIGTGGSDLVEGRDVKNHTFNVDGNFTSITVRIEQSPSGGLCEGGECAPSNVQTELDNPAGETLARNATANEVKWMNLTGQMSAGEWELRVKGDQGAAVGYTYEIEIHYDGLCAEAGGLSGFECAAAPEPISSDSGPVLP